MVEFREIPGHSKDYVAGDDGRIYSLKKGEPRPLKGSLDGNKVYLHVWAYPNDRPRVSRNVHILMLLAFHGEKPSPAHTASHINGDPQDNRPSNLKWEEHSDNVARKLEHGTHDRGLNNSRACVDSEQLNYIRTLLAEGIWTQQQIADKVGISRSMVTRIKNGQKYSDF